MSQPRIETLILKNLIYEDGYARRVIPYIKDTYFRETHEKAIFNGINDFINKYKTLPTKESIEVILDNSGIVEEVFQDSLKTLNELENLKDKKVNQDWLIEETEKFCQEKALSCAAFEAVAILEGTDKKRGKGEIPHLFEAALGISFDPSIGHNYIENAEDRYDKLHAPTTKIPFDIGICNEVTKGGIAGKTLNVLAGGVYVGKTLGLCHLAASYLRKAKNPLYITLEIAEENIGLRIDCNLLNISTDDADSIPKDLFLKKVNKFKENLQGQLIIKEYPAGSIHVNNIRALLHELQIKKNFKPDVILIDYINLIASSRVKPSDKTHITIQAVAEELRSLAQEYDIPIWTATQLDAEGMTSSDPSMTNIQGSKVGLIATADLLWMMVSSEKLRELGQMLVIQHKNRYKDAADHKKFYIGVDRKKMRWYDVEQKSQNSSDEDDSEEDDYESVKKEVSKKYGQEAYTPAYGTGFTKQFGPRNRKSKFDDFKV